VEFNLSDVQQSWRERGRALGRDLAAGAAASDVIAAAARAGLLASDADLLAVAVCVDAIATESAAAAIAFALHSAAARATSSAHERHASDLAAGEVVGALALAADDVPVERDGRLSGTAAWVAPLTSTGVAIVGARTSAATGGGKGPDAAALRAWLVPLADPDVRIEPVETAGLHGLVCGHVRLNGVSAIDVGPPAPIMAVSRILLASAGLGMGRRALRESMKAARALDRHGAGGEQTVQGLLADAATELDAAMLLTWKAATSATLSLAEASMAKLAATEATQRAVARATQMIGSESFREGHVIESLSQDVRALELFAGRTEALREAVALETLPRT
jgi:alkylation response protein AidB-like acyl-CoA dehydrogenase